MSSSVDTPVVMCTSCGVDVPLVFPAMARTVVCPACGAQLDLDSPSAQVISSITLGLHKAEGLIETGRVGRFGQLAAQVVGRMRMASSEGMRSSRWEDWVIATQDGRVVWIREEDGAYSLMTPFSPEVPLSDEVLAATEVGATVPFDGMGARLDVRMRAKVVHVEGELPVRVCAADFLTVVELETPNGVVLLNRTYDSDMYFRIDPMEDRAIWEIFGYHEMVHAHDALFYNRAQARERSEAFRKAASVFFGSGFLGGILIFALYMMSASVGEGWTRFDFQPQDTVLEQDVGGALLHGGMGHYTLSVRCELGGGSHLLDLVAVQDETEVHLLRCTQSTMVDGVAEVPLSFRVDGAKPLRLLARHKARPEQSGSSIVRWQLYRHTGSLWWPMGAVCLLVVLGGLSLVAWPLTDRIGARALEEEYDQRKAKLALAVFKRNRESGDRT